MRGENILKNGADNHENESKAKGRNRSLNARRNECMADRYYYYTTYTEKRYDAIIELLSAEFFLSVSTVTQVMQNQMEHLQALKQQKLSVYYFRHKWQHMKW